MQKYKNRDEVPEKYKWDLTDFYKDEKDFNNSFKKMQKQVEELKKYVGCTKDENKLYEFLKFDLNVENEVEKIYIYSYLINDQELGNSKSIDRKDKSTDLMNKYALNTSFFKPELLELTKEEYDNLFSKNESLGEFKKMLDDVYRTKEHILSEKEENIINSLENAMNFDDMSSTMLNSEHDYGTIIVEGKEEKITPTNLSVFMKNNDRDLRKNAREKFNKVLGNYGTSSAQFLNSYVKNNIAVCKLHNFKDAWDAKLFNLEMPNSVFDKLIETVSNNVGSLQNYYRVFKKAVGLDELHQYDTALEIVKKKKEYSIEEAQELCLNALEPLGDDYIKHFKKIFDNRYIDYACYPSKCSGGYSFAPNDLDSRILMSYNYDLNSVSTIIHEGGHNVHHQYISQNNKLQYRYVSAITSEVVSLTNECLLSSYLAKNGKTIDEKISGIDNILSVIISNLFGAVREGKMEKDFYDYVNEGHSITKDYMNDLTYKSLEYFHKDSVILDEYSAFSWMRRSHYYMNYYLFNYAICISVASNVAKEILEGNEEMLKKYLEFLKLGNETKPMDAFKVLGVDLNESLVYENAIKYFDGLVIELDKLVGGKNNE